jgi:hypothetical protein
MIATPQSSFGEHRRWRTERLNHLVEHGVLERRPYDAPPRYEYDLTDRGAELFDVLMVMVGWGDKWPTAGSRCTPRTSTCWLVRARQPEVAATIRAEIEA